MSEYDNNLRYVDDIEDVSTAKDEILPALGGAWKIGGVAIPPPTAGSLMLLEWVDSPFVARSLRDLSAGDVFEALFIFCHGRDAARLLAVRAKIDKAARQAFNDSAKTPEHLEVYLARIARDADDMAAWDAAVGDFAQSFEGFDFKEAAEVIGDYLKISMGGFAMIPQGEEEPKKKDLT